MHTIDDIQPNPWDFSSASNLVRSPEWFGEVISADGCEPVPFKKTDVVRVVTFWFSGDGWDGDSAAVIQLSCGRFVAWECGWRPTGNGFCADAYGGTTDLVFGWTVGAALAYIGDEARERLEEQISG